MRRKPTLLIFAKEPRLGRVKSRLARDIGATAALHFYRGNLTRLHRQLSVHSRWRVIWCLAPDRAVHARRAWPRGVKRQAQGRGDLGQRMARALNDAPPGPVLLIGSDIPAIDAASMQQAISLLGRKDAVFGPAEDGGYWLVGFRRIRPVPYGLFRGVRWSGPFALGDTIATLPAGARVGFAAVLPDVDDGPSYGDWKESRNGTL
ncbi:glycosyltransferase [Hwanghaeella grinnelliae]|uniref:Glycosyltransferase n=1 Tax=Hwanghaeella grinnelliae TaxID=2500179 RepID=A0A437QTM5_9PROT|nr:TIGR04282 family arsenosugar biosynthesis glycosyltransferase [Hwanghaeella grinnelliae]RVU37829.1 glycosyltransferase [Hwanghaeella grinnelliae]